MHSATQALPSPQDHFRDVHISRKGDLKVRVLKHSKGILLSFQVESFLPASTLENVGAIYF